MSEKNWTADWLRRVRITDDSMGDVIADMRRDPNVPSLFHHIRDMHSYLTLKGASIERLAAVPILWRRYSQWLARTQQAEALKAHGLKSRPPASKLKVPPGG
jgi:hypothetical protein